VIGTVSSDRPSWELDALQSLRKYLSVCQVQAGKGCCTQVWHTVRHGHHHTYQTPVPLSTTAAAIQSHCLPLQLPPSVHTTTDVELTTLCGCFAGLVTGYVSDTSLHEFVTANKERQAAGQPKQQLLQTGQHPSMLYVWHQKGSTCLSV